MLDAGLLFSHEIKNCFNSSEGTLLNIASNINILDENVIRFGYLFPPVLSDKLDALLLKETLPKPKTSSKQTCIASIWEFINLEELIESSNSEELK